MHVRNQTSRWHLCIEAIDILSKEGKIPLKQANAEIKKFQKRLQDHYNYITKFGDDPDEIKYWKYVRD